MIFDLFHVAQADLSLSRRLPTPALEDVKARGEPHSEEVRLVYIKL